MSSRTRTRQVVVVIAVLAGAGLAGCGAPSAPDVATARVGGTASATAAPTSVDPARQARLYIDCMRKQGVAMKDELTSEGMPQVDKTKTSEAQVSAAAQKCRTLLPAEAGATQSGAVDIERARGYAACLRNHGVPGWPDPDPVTGQPQMNDAEAARLKSDPHLPAALQACQDLTPGGSGPGVVGG